MSNSLTTFAKIAQKRIESAALANRPSGKLLFALDASGSRESTWAMSKKLTIPLFARIRELGELSISLGYFNGGTSANSFADQCQFSTYVSDAEQLTLLMNQVSCMSCNTQIEKILDHALLETLKPVGEKPSAMIYIGDDMEENLTSLVTKARVLHSRNFPIFMFLENTSYTSNTDRSAFKAIAEASGGAFAEFTEGAADVMLDWIKSAVSFAIGGLAALTREANRGSKSAQLLLTQMK